jgi:hypothetical protein
MHLAFDYIIKLYMVTGLKGLSKDILEDKFMHLKLAQRVQVLPWPLR